MKTMSARKNFTVNEIARPAGLHSMTGKLKSEKNKQSAQNIHYAKNKHNANQSYKTVT